LKNAQKNERNTVFRDLKNENSTYNTQNRLLYPTLEFAKYCDLHFYICILKNTQKQAQIFTLLKSHFRENLSLFFNLKFKIIRSELIQKIVNSNPTLMKNEMDEFAKKFLT
jgi:hypothetical protein